CALDLDGQLVLEHLRHELVDIVIMRLPLRIMRSLLVCRERSIVMGDEGRIMTRPSSRPEARSLLGCQTVNELGAPVASSIPEQLPGHEPASARMGYEDGHALFLRYRRVEGPLGMWWCCLRGGSFR